MTNQGTLFVVATPIGNLGDLSPRAQQVLRDADLVAAEDTRHSHKLLQHCGIETPLQAYHDYSDAAAVTQLLQRLADGATIALISDAGTPLISDPGYRLVNQAREQGSDVIPIPGPSALTAALSVAGLPSDSFRFEGFLAAKASARDKQLQQLASESCTLVFYEAPHRLQDTLQALREAFGDDRQVFVGRELTKQFESHFRGTLAAALQWADADSNNRRGEFVLVVAGREQAAGRADAEAEAVRIVEILLEDLPLKRAVAIACKLTGARKNPVYDAALGLSQEE